MADTRLHDEGASERALTPRGPEGSAGIVRTWPVLLVLLGAIALVASVLFLWRSVGEHDDAVVRLSQMEATVGVEAAEMEERAAAIEARISSLEPRPQPAASGGGG